MSSVCEDDDRPPDADPRALLDGVRLASTRAETALPSATTEAARAGDLATLVRCTMVEASVLALAEPGATEIREARIDDRSAVAHALSRLATELSPAARVPVLDRARRAAREAGNGWELCAVAEASEAPLAAEIAREAIASLRAAQEPAAEPLVRVARFLPEREALASLRETFAAACSRDAGAEARTDALHAFAAGARSLPAALAEGVWPWGLWLTPADGHALLAALAPRFAPARRAAAVERAAREVLVFLEQGGLASDVVSDLRSLASYLVEPALTSCLSRALSMDPYIRGIALPDLIERVAVLGRGAEGLALVRACPDDEPRVEALVRILPHLAPAERNELSARLVSDLRGMHADLAAERCWRHAGRLSRVVPAPHLLALARTFHGASRMHALAALADHLPVALRREAMREAVLVARALDSADLAVLADLPPHARDLAVEDALYLFLRVLRGLGDVKPGSLRGSDLLTPSRGLALGDLAPLLHRLGGEAAVLGAAREIERVVAWFR